MAPSKKGAKTQSQVVHHDEDDLIQVRDRDEAEREWGTTTRSTRTVRMGRDHLDSDDGRHRAER